MKKVKALCLALAAMLCLAAGAWATPQINITNIDDGAHFNAEGQPYSQYATLQGDGYSPFFQFNAGTSQADMITAEELMALIPEDFTDIVSADVYLASEFTDSASATLPIKKYTYGLPYNMPYYLPQALPCVETIILIDANGQSESFEAQHGESYDSPVLEFTTTKELTYPVRLYGVTLTHTEYPSFAITAPQTENGTITADPASVKEGGSTKVTVKANDGYVIKSVTVGGEQKDASEWEANPSLYEFTLENVTADV